MFELSSHDGALAAAGVTLLTVGLLLAAGLRSQRTVRHLGHRFVTMVPTTLAYVTVFGVGVALELGRSDARLQPVAVACGVVAVVFVWSGSWFLNDVSDTDIDELTNPDRPLVEGHVTERETLLTAVALLALGIAYATIASVSAAGAVAGMAAVNALYSLPPVRLKRNAVTSLASIGAIGGFATLAGSAAVAGSPTASGVELAVVVFAFMTVNLSYQDLKDAESDARAGVDTLVTRYGQAEVRDALTVTLPASYLVGGLVVGVTRPLWFGVFVVTGALAVVAVRTTDPDDISLMYRLDAVNSAYLASLGVAFLVSA